MKKNVASLLCIMLCFSGFAQPYQSIFGNENANWTITNRGIIPEDAWMDTISTNDIEGEYHILEFRSKWSDMNQIIGKIRTNETNSKLYFVEPDSTTELLIMDLDLEIGDAFNIKTLYGQNKTIYVDNIYLFNGKKHIQFNDEIGLSTPPGGSKRIFIEGVGPNWGFESEFIYLTVCKYEDFIQTYSLENEYIKDCRFKNVNIDNYENDIKIYPNPATNMITVFSNGNDYITQLYILDFLGRIMYEYIPNSSAIHLNIENLSKGIYFIQCRINNTNSVNSNFIKL